MNFADQQPVSAKVLVMTGTKKQDALRFFRDEFERRGSSVEIVDASQMAFGQGALMLAGLTRKQSVMIDAVNAYEMPIAKKLALVARHMRPRRYTVVLVADDDPLKLTRFADKHFYVHRASWHMDTDIRFLAQEQESQVCESAV